MKMIDRTLRLTWRKGLLMLAVWAVLALAHFAVGAVWNVDEPVLLLAATFIVPIWAISAALYTFDNYVISPGHGRRPPAH
jgi:hypothetical protein